MSPQTAQRLVAAVLGCICLLGRASLPARGAEPPEPKNVNDVHRWIRLALEYRTAVQAGDFARVEALQAPNARVWFDEKTGEGRALDARGKGPWAQWDAFFRARSTAADYVVVDDAVRFTNRETNDWFRLIERESVPYFIFYFFDDEDRISGKLIQAIEGLERAPDRLDEFKAWAAKKHPGLIEQLMPEKRIDPQLDKAQLWKQRLTEWRAEVGLPDVPDDPD